MSYNLGQTVELTFTVTPDEVPTLTVTAPNGTVRTPAVTGSAGSYRGVVDADQLGTWVYVWSTPNGGDQHGTFTVKHRVITLAEVKTRLNKTTTADDAELQDMLDAALAEYEQRVGPTGTKTLRFDGAPVIILPRNATRLTSVAYSNGTAVALTDVDFDVASGLLRYGFTRGSRNVTITFAVALPANHREAILSDVAGLFAATQRGNSPGALPSGYEAAYQQEFAGSSGPVNLFPRIRALAESFPSIA